MRIAGDKIIHAYYRWKSINDNEWEGWLEFLGVNHFKPIPDVGGKNWYDISDEAGRRINMLNGPHWYALLRAMEAQYVIGKGL